MTLELLKAHRDKLDALAHTLLERETLDEDEAYRAAGVVPSTATTGDSTPPS